MFKNKAERVKFLKEYREWWRLEKGGTEIFTWFEVEVIFHGYSFRNGAAVIVTECEVPGKFEKRYNLILPPGDEYNPYNAHSGRTSSEFESYNLHGVSVSTIVDYMTKRKNEI